MMYYRLLITIICLLMASNGFGFDTLKVNAELDDERKEITGFVDYKLPVNFTGQEIQFQLYANVFQSDSTPYLIDGSYGRVNPSLPTVYGVKPFERPSRCPRGLMITDVVFQWL